MRTTFDIRDDVLQRVREYAAARSITNGAAVTEVLERGFNAGPPTRWENGLLIFDPGEGADAVTLEHTLALEDAMEDELH